MTKKKSNPQAKRVQDEPKQDLVLIVRMTPGADHYRIEGDKVYICAQNGFILKEVKKVQ